MTTRGGKRPNAGRKYKFEGKTMRLWHTIPIAWFPEFKRWYAAMMKKEKK